MKSPFASTAMMAVAALISTAAAAYFYPWPEFADTVDLINQPLFEEYDYNQVRTIEIVQFNRDTDSLETIQLRRSGEKWIIPNKDNYVATNATAISATVNALNSLLVLEVMSDQQQDHFEYGVVDPEDYQSVKNLSGLGIRITLSDRNKKEIASLIVGKGRKSDSERTRFVRKAGQPQIYAIEFDTGTLATDFRRWVSPNLMNLQARDNPMGQRIGQIAVQNYRIDAANLAAGEKQMRNELAVSFADNKINILKFTMPDPANPGALKDAQPLQEDLGRIYQISATIPFENVIKKNDRLAKALRARDPAESNQAFAGLNNYGFRKVGFEDGVYLIEGVRGEMAVVTTEGVRIRLLIGGSTGNLSSNSGRPERYVMMTAQVDLGFFPEPQKPADAEENSDEIKAYLREVEAREQKIKLAGDVATALNRSYSEWFYVIDAAVADLLVPDIREAPKQESAN